MTPAYAFDIDGVLCHTGERFRAHYLAHHGVILEPGGDYQTFGWTHDSDEIVDHLREHGLSVWRELVHEGTPDGLSTVLRLAEEGRFLGYVTRRDPGMWDVTRTWLEQYGFPVATYLLHFVDSWYFTEEHGEKPCKSHVVNFWLRGWKGGPAFEDCVLVEDSPDEARRAAQSGLRVAVLRASYNREFEREVAREDIVPGWRRRVSFVDSLTELE